MTTNNTIKITKEITREIGNEYGKLYLEKKGYSVIKIKDTLTQYSCEKNNKKYYFKILSRNKHGKNGINKNHITDLNVSEMKKYDEAYILDMYIDFDNRTYEPRLIKLDKNNPIKDIKTNNYPATQTFKF